MVRILDRLRIQRANDVEGRPELDALSRALGQLYDEHAAYFEQAERNNHAPFYEAYLPIIDDLIRRAGTRKVRILEIGAGRSSFASWLSSKQRRQQVDVTLQDITSSNESWLTSQADRVLICDATEEIGGGPYDLIFCTFVYEHLVRPDRFLEHALAALGDSGVLIITAPKYDVPGYIPPALRHLSRLDQLAWNAAILVRACRQAFTGKPQFWVTTRPAVLEQPYFRDSDAVHLVSKRDVTLALRSRAVPIPLNAPPRRSLHKVLGPLMLLHVAFQKHT